MGARVTQTELARRINKTQSFVADLERGERRLDVIDYLSVAEAIGVDPLTILAEVFLVNNVSR